MLHPEPPQQRRDRPDADQGDFVGSQPGASLPGLMGDVECGNSAKDRFDASKATKYCRPPHSHCSGLR